MLLSFEAMLFACEVHKTQRRKYTGDPYVAHLAEVAGIVACAESDMLSDERDLMVAVAWLHDCVEDQEVSFDILSHKFGDVVSKGVWMLSDIELGNRAERKAAARARLATAPGWVQSIKCADLISNTSSIVLHDPKFAVTFLQEKHLLLDVLTKADPLLLKMARE